MLTLALIAAQVLLGALDNLLHHELTEKLPSHASAARELALHSARELLYGVIFLVVAWAAPCGLWALVLLALVLFELGVTLADFVEEDRTRTLPPLERVLHTVLAVNLGLILASAAPTWLDWLGRPSALRFEPRGLASPAFTVCANLVAAWGVRDLLAALTLTRKAAARPQPPARPSGRTLLVTGATGFLGEAFTWRRLARGDEIVVLSRDPRRARALFDGRVLAISDLREIPSRLRIDAIVNLAGASVAAGPWTDARKRVLVESRIRIADELHALVTRLKVRPAVLVNASGAGVYGDRGEEVLNERSVAGAGFPTDLCLAWEAAAHRIAELGPRTVLLRFGLVLGGDGGAWPAMTTALKAGLGVRFGDGHQFMPWIHKSDALGLIETAVDDPRLQGPVNAVAPTPARHGEVMAAAARSLGGRLVLGAPAPLLRLALGEMASLFLDSQRVEPRAAQAVGFAFRFPTIEAAAKDLLTPARRGRATGQGQATARGRA